MAHIPDFPEDLSFCEVQAKIKHVTLTEYYQWKYKRCLKTGRTPKTCGETSRIRDVLAVLVRRNEDT